MEGRADGGQRRRHHGGGHTASETAAVAVGRQSAGHVGVAQPDRGQIGFVPMSGFGQLCDLIRRVRTSRRGGDATGDVIPLGRVGGEKAGQAPERQLVLAGRVHRDHLGELCPQVLREGPNGGRRIAPVALGPRFDVFGRADADERLRAEAGLVVVDQAHRDRRQVRDSVIEGGAERDAGRAGAQRLQAGFVVADALGEQRHQAALCEERSRGAEGRVVPVLAPPARGIGRIRGPVDGHHPRQVEERGQRHDLEEGGLAEEARVAGQHGHQHQPVDQSVHVVGHQHERPSRRQA